MQVAGAEQDTQLVREVPIHALALRQNVAAQLLHAVPSMLQSAQFVMDVVQASQVPALHHSVPDVHGVPGH